MWNLRLTIEFRSRALSCTLCERRVIGLATGTGLRQCNGEWESLPMWKHWAKISGTRKVFSWVMTVLSHVTWCWIECKTASKSVTSFREGNTTDIVYLEFTNRPRFARTKNYVSWETTFHTDSSEIDKRKVQANGWSRRTQFERSFRKFIVEI